MISYYLFSVSSTFIKTFVIRFYYFNLVKKLFSYSKVIKNSNKNVDLKLSFLS